MKQKIFKVEFALLFVISIISVIYYFFSNHLPDNSLNISSHSSDYYSYLYYLSSVFAEINYYVGPWIIMPFISFAFVYSFILTRRDKEGDLLVSISFIFFFYFFTLAFFPTFLGQGLKSLSENYVDIYFSFFSVIIFAFTSFYLVMRGSFFVLVRRLNLFFTKNAFKTFNGVKKLSVSTKALAYHASDVTKSIGNSTKKIPIKELSSNLSKAVASKKSKNIEDIQPETVSKITPRIEEIKNSYIGDESKITSERVLNDENVSNNIKDEKSKNELVIEERMPGLNKEQVPSQEQVFFKSSDLIDCISANVKHNQTKGPDDSYFNQIIKAIEEKLAEFKLDGKIINILKGPVVDTFELELGSGVKVSKVTGLSDDIGLALNGAPIRIVYPMRGRSTIGIEVPRSPRDFIFLDEVMQSQSFNDSKQRLPIAMGKDAFGDVKVVDLAGMPHMLVAGATGAGKSVFINSLLVSLIVKKSPRELKLILIDPKQLELALFSDLPHLMLPVITDPTSSAVALLWAVEEMDKRYTILKEMGVKNIEGFNKKVKTCDQNILFKINEYYEDKEDPGYELPYIVVVIDEFADLILSKAGKEIETNVNRLAAKARAAGIHLVVATQRPSTDVVTGVVKANFPTRVAFRVSTGHDSKTILDQYGAEKLLGKGDMLYKHGVDLMRMHSSFVDENEVEGLIDKLATIPQSFNQGAVDFLESGGEDLDSVDDGGKSASFTSGTSDDPVYQQALEVVMENGSASASMLQRRLRVGYNRAANLVEEMERNGIVGPAQGSKPRKVLARNE